MKICPYCWEEIQNSAKKCRYCWEFLPNETSIKKVKKDYWFRWRFFRKDLELNKKRLHRFFVIIFFILLFWIPFKSAFSHVLNDDRERFEVVDKAENRIWNDVKQLWSILKASEHIDNFYDEIWEIGHESSKNKWMIDENYRKNAYCSKRWDLSKIQKLSRDLGIEYDTRNGDTWNNILNTVKNNKCVLIDSMGWDSKFLNYTLVKLTDLSIVKQTSKSNWYQILRRANNYLMNFIPLFVVWLIIIVIYYKIIIYIVYGSYKE